MDGNGLMAATRAAAPVALNTLGVNIFHGPRKDYGRRAA
jgi:hypothetical protein